MIHYWIKYKRENEVDAIRMRPHPYEFCMYFDISDGCAQSNYRELGFVKFATSIPGVLKILPIRCRPILPGRVDRDEA